MKQPMYALLIAPDHRMRTNVVYGGKTITIREGHRGYQPSLVMLCCHLVPWAVMADITNVRHCTLREVTQEEYEDDGFHSQEDLLQGMQRFYPNLTLDSPVTVIRWEKVRGFLVDYCAEYRLLPEKLYSKIKHGD
ncbi:ASCH domain-containing protein [Patescibacteria group bacterium]|nr:ASCH domain-containing protein [Patescibacteria group bacterium]